MKLPLVLIGILLLAQGAHLGAEPDRDARIRVALHDSRGLTSASAPDGILELNLFKSHTHIHLLLSNLSDRDLALWRPLCPEGDAAIVIEFRAPEAPEAVFRARPAWAYTGGMGLPKTFTLAAHDAVIINVDFFGGLPWSFPMPIANGESRELEVRVGYRSKNLADEDRKRYGTNQVEKVWEGETSGDWQRIWVRNRSGGPLGSDR